MRCTLITIFVLGVGGKLNNYAANILPTQPLIKLIKALGVSGAARELKVSEDEVRRQVSLLGFRYDTELFSSNHLKIVDKLGNLIPLIYKKGQKIINSAIEKQKLEKKPVRIALLKARQFGGSTLFEAELFKESVLRQHRSSMIIAHDLDSARHLREMSGRYYDNYVEEKPRIKKESEKWWKFEHRVGKQKADSHLRIDTAEELSTGHSLTLHNLHLSEIQNWRNAAVLVKGLFPTVPNSFDTMIFMEGTGSGVGDYWYDFCQMAQDKSSGWEFVFVPWFEIEDYESSFSTLDLRGDFLANLDAEEEVLYKQGVSLEKLFWRRETIKNSYKGDVDAFRQQYPATADEAFLTSGRPVFSAIKVKQGMAKSEKPLRTVYLEEKKGVVKEVEDVKGYWQIFEEPNSSLTNLYACGADVAEGIQVVPELGNRGGDFSVAKILRRDTRRFVAVLRERLDPDIFADELYKAGLYWKCGIMPESNAGGHGNVVIRNLKAKSNINLLKTPILNKAHDDIKDAYGWRTMQDTKRQLIDELNEKIREEEFSDPSKNFWYEASTYVRDEKGRTNAQPRKYDDEVIATAIAFQADKLMPMVFKEVPDEKEYFVHPGDDVPQNFRSEMTERHKVMEQVYAEY